MTRVHPHVEPTRHGGQGTPACTQGTRARMGSAGTAGHTSFDDTVLDLPLADDRSSCRRPLIRQNSNAGLPFSPGELGTRTFIILRSRKGLTEPSAQPSSLVNVREEDRSDDLAADVPRLHAILTNRGEKRISGSPFDSGSSPNTWAYSIPAASSSISTIGSLSIGASLGYARVESHVAHIPNKCPFDSGVGYARVSRSSVETDKIERRRCSEVRGHTVEILVTPLTMPFPPKLCISGLQLDLALSGDPSAKTVSRPRVLTSTHPTAILVHLWQERYLLYLHLGLASDMFIIIEGYTFSVLYPYPQSVLTDSHYRSPQIRHLPVAPRGTKKKETRGNETKTKRTVHCNVPGADRTHVSPVNSAISIYVQGVIYRDLQGLVLDPVAPCKYQLRIEYLAKIRTIPLRGTLYTCQPSAACSFYADIQNVTHN
ncbi:hypothetical protein DFH06DRAFT_1127988 [Mycena polygramma]|nr:hypothetical protein DFH06DRAFT_1127988 [Mycena polygramma]